MPQPLFAEHCIGFLVANGSVSLNHLRSSNLLALAPLRLTVEKGRYPLLAFRRVKDKRGKQPLQPERLAHWVFRSLPYDFARKTDRRRATFRDASADRDRLLDHPFSRANAGGDAEGACFTSR